MFWTNWDEHHGCRIYLKGVCGFGVELGMKIIKLLTTRQTMNSPQIILI